ncbi:MAG: VWA domain-containing protein [Myxococcales bacterium]|nr:VWA domain-containing protein [Myxococcales bacterium]
MLDKVISKLQDAERRHQERHTPLGLRYVIADGIDFLNPAHWDAIARHATVFLGRAYLAALERHAPSNTEPRYAIVYQQDAPVAILACQIAQIGGEQLVASGRKRSAKKRLLGQVRERVLVCGNLVSSGLHGIAFAEGLDPELGWRAVAEILYRIRRGEKLHGSIDFVLVKDLVGERYAPSTVLERYSYRTIKSDPDMVLALACTRDPVMAEDDTTTDATTTTTSPTTTSATTGTTTDDPDSSGPPPDPTSTDTGEVLPCMVDGSCGAVDLLFVIDNSGSMGEEQLTLARSFQDLVDELVDLRGSQGDLLAPDVRIMVTTTDMGHPLCTAFYKPDYTPQQGAPIYEGCNARINRFTGIDPNNPIVIEEACTENCPVDVAPQGHFVQFGPMGTNVPNDDVGTALACIGPQGIDGCGYESPLEAMLQALNESAC